MYQIQYRPQRFQDLPINLSCSWNEAGGISGETRVNVPMYVKEANRSSDFLISRKMQIWIGIKSPPEIFPILTHQIVIEDQQPDSIHVVFHRGIDTIIHIHLSYMAKSMLARLHIEGALTSLPAGNLRRNSDKSTRGGRKHLRRFRYKLYGSASCRHS